jgi:hypothetical protein
VKASNVPLMELIDLIFNQTDKWHDHKSVTLSD